MANFRIVGMLFGIYILCAPGFPVEPNEEQPTIVDELLKTGALIRVDKNSSDYRDLAVSWSWHYYSKVSDDELLLLSNLSNVRSLDLHRSKISDAGLVYLEGMNQLEELNLEDTGITDAGLEHLKGLTRLQTLNIRFNRISNAGIAHLKGLDKLHALDIFATMITPRVIDSLKENYPHSNPHARGRTRNQTTNILNN